MSRSDSPAMLHLDMPNLCADMAWVQISKKNETICGDFFTVADQGEKQVLVLSDGLGSGVKANILSTLTATMLSQMVAGGVAARDAVQAVTRTLPVCSVRGLAYATFSLLEFTKDTVYLLQYDNPDLILIRNDTVTEYPIHESYLGEKHLHESFLKIQEGDMLVLMSDGITNAGMGKTTNGGWGRHDVIQYCNSRYAPGMSARDMACRIADAGLALNTYGVDDDMTVLVLRICKPQITNLMIGPPSDPANDSMYMNRFFQLPGRHIICGGTTAHIAANLLGKTLHTISGSGLDDIPAAMELDGVDYITEGQLTLERLLEYCREWDDDPVDFLARKKSTNPAMKLMDYLFSKSTHINIFFGSAENQSQRELQLTSEAKQRKVEELIAHLKKQGKIVNNAYWAI